MSLTSLIKKIGNWIASIFKGIPAETKTAIRLGVEITERIKSYLASPVVDVLTALIPGQADDAAVAALRMALPKILQQLQLAENCINSTDDAAKTHCALQTLSKLTGDVQNSFFHSISILLAQVAADGKLTWGDGVYLLEWYYKNNFKAN